MFHARMIVAVGLLFPLLSLTVSPGHAGESLPIQCPQPRFTGKAPPAVYWMTNPLAASRANIATGRKLYRSEAKPLACQECHGRAGDGRGPMAYMFDPPPRNFTCAETVNGIPDGQLFWIIQNGSPGTGMPDFHGLSNDQIWRIVLYLRQLANPK